MAMYKGKQPGSAPTQDSQLYPDTDGKPMAASDDHRRVLMRILRVLEAFFSANPDVYVSGDLLMYYVQGDPRKAVAPDVLVSFGIGQKSRRTYLVWQEGKPPDFVMELASKSTYESDLGEKMQIYAALGIADYFLCDIEGLYLPTPLMGFTLIEGVYEPIEAATDGSLHSAALGLDFHMRPGDLRLYDAQTRQWLLTPEEAADARAEQEAIARRQADARAEQEAIARRQADTRVEAAEMEVAELRAELARLRGNS